jgi:ABC-type nitrate/sulfonate/bicarbonate transport system substrate-binding protein
VRYAGIIFLAIVSFFSLNLSVQASDTLKIQLRWKHQFQFAGYYIAKEKGFYEARGLDVELIEGGPQALSPIDDLLSGKVDFAITGSGVAIDRMEGQPVVAVAAIMQKKKNKQ